MNAVGEIGNFGKHVLLTGAGFSKNWGGLLAEGVRAAILSSKEIQARPSVQSLIKSEKYFEPVWEKVHVETSVYNADDRAAMQDAIKRIFKEMDDRYKTSVTVNSGHIDANVANMRLLQRFKSSGADTAYLFTVNQDTAHERIWRPQPPNLDRIVWPGVTQHGELIDSITKEVAKGTVRAANVKQSELRGQCNLIKLHGSANWLTDDGRSTMVIGLSKRDQIAGSPLLNFYQQVFEKVLASGEVRLMAIGYSFGDGHINEAIADAIERSGLKLFVWDPRDPTDFLKSTSVPHGEKILRGLIGMELRLLSEVLPTYNPASSSTDALDQVLRQFFDS